jgi:hypothetical protein
MTEGTIPRLMLIAEDSRFPPRLEPRPDYLLRPHADYINVFYIGLPPTACIPWAQPLAFPTLQQLDDEAEGEDSGPW